MNKVLKLVLATFLLSILGDIKVFAGSNIKKISKQQEDSLVVLYRQIFDKNTDTEKRKANEEFNKALRKLSNLELMNIQFDTLKKTIAIIDAPDKTFRIINWTVFYNSKGVYDFYGFILSKESDSIHLYPLNDVSAKIPKPEEVVTTNNDWYGALYYDVIKSGTKDDPYYVLLGWDGNDLFTNRKVIDVLWFDENYIPNFGKPVFYFGNDDIRQRVVFEFSENSSMKLKYEPKYQMLIFDHLVPDKPHLEGNTEYYGADFTFDALKYEDERWILVEDVNLKNPKTKLSNRIKNK